MTEVLSQRLGVELPIIQAPMAGSQGSAIAIAVSNAGGLGSLPCALLDIETIRRELATIRSGTSKPYNVNFFCHVPPTADAARERAWREALAPYYRAYGVDARAIPAGPGRRPFSAEFADAIEEFKPPIVSFHFGLPSTDLLRRVRRWGAVVLSSATTVDEARWLEANGADVVIAQGLEAGGHRGHFLSDDLTLQMGTLALVRQIVQAVRVPVVAAGGIADANSVTAMLALGAAGVQVGTAYLLCPEATTSHVHRQGIAAAAARGATPHTALTNLFTGRPARGIVNRIMRDLGPLNPIAPPFPLASAAMLPLRAAGEAAGHSDFSPLWAGQNASACRQIPASALTRELALGCA